MEGEHAIVPNRDSRLIMLRCFVVDGQPKKKLHIKSDMYAVQQIKERDVFVQRASVLRESYFFCECFHE